MVSLYSTVLVGVLWFILKRCHKPKHVFSNFKTKDLDNLGRWIAKWKENAKNDFNLTAVSSQEILPDWKGGDEAKQDSN